jgi:major membrane immunogen (membrane-anchored lipoprotein)
MSVSVENLKKAVAELPEDKLKEFRSWYEAFDAETWDRQMEQDINDGKLDYLAEKAILEYKAGKATEL